MSHALLFYRSSYFQNLSYYYHMPQAIINTIHAMINKIYTIIIYPMPLLTIWCYYQPTHAIISKTHPIIKHLILLSTLQRIILTLHIILLLLLAQVIQFSWYVVISSTTSSYFRTPMSLSNKWYYYQTTHIIIKHLILLSTLQPIILKLNIIL